jgi:hypothetical protein
MRRRWKPSWVEDDRSANEVLIGRVGLFDVYYEYDYEGSGQHWIMLVGPDPKKLDPISKCNFDVYVIENRSSLEPYEHIHGRQDLHIELAEMCEIYRLCVERGYIEEK